MGTRCLTVVKDQSGRELVNLYRQMDGYPEGHGEELASFLKDRPIINGIPVGRKYEVEPFNGMGCLAASLVAHFKTGIGGFYLFPTGTRGVDEEYVYTVTGKPGDKEAKIQVVKV